MPIDVQWDDDNQTVIRYVFKTPWTWTEYHAAIEQAWTMAKSVDHPTDTITDMSGSRLLPDNPFKTIDPDGVGHGLSGQGLHRAFVGELDRVAQQVDQDLAQFPHVGLYVRNAYRFGFYQHRQSLFCGA